MSATQRALFVVPPALLVLALIGVPFLRRQSAAPQQLQFELVEATISDVHRAIQQGQITCRGLVEAYLQRARAYNHSSDRLVTRDGKPIPPARGTVRAGKPIEFPTETVPISLLLPNFDRYAGPPIEFGRMEPTASDPEVQQQYGMTVGTPNSGKVNTLATFNLRGERSVTCKGDRDRHPSSGSLPAGAPPVCEEFGKQPDALERASELDAQYGRNPDLTKLPMYCIPFSFKDPFDTKDMRTTAGADARYDIDFPARDHTLVAQLRAKGAIIYAKAVSTEYNGRAGDPGGPHRPERILVSTQGYQRSSWSGNPTTVYDTGDVCRTVPRVSVLDKPYAASAAASGAAGSLKGVRIGVIRESMLIFPGVKADEPIVTAAAKEIKRQDQFASVVSFVFDQRS